MTFQERRRFSVEGICVDLTANIETYAAKDPSLREIIGEELLRFASELQRRIWSKPVPAVRDSYNLLGNPVEQLAALAADQDPGKYWRPIELASMAIEAGLFSDLFAGHEPGQRLNKRTASSFGKRLVASKVFRSDGFGHSRRYFLDHENHHGRHHSKSKPAPLELFANK